MATIPEVPWPGERIRGYWDIFTDSPKDFWTLLLDDPGVVTLEAGDEFRVTVQPTELMRAGDIVGECNWILEAVSGSATVEVSHGFQARDNYPDPPVWETITTATVGPDARAVFPTPTAHRTYDHLAQTDTLDGYIEVKVRVLTGELVADNLYLQAEPPGGLLVIVGTTLSGLLTPEPAQDSGFFTGPLEVQSKAELSWVSPDFGGTAGPKLQECAAIARAGGNVVGLLTSPYITTPPTGQGFSRASTGTPGGDDTRFADVRMYVEYQALQDRDIPSWRRQPAELQPLIDGRDYVYAASPGGVEFEDAPTVRLAWLDWPVRWTQHSAYTISHLGVQPGDLDSTLGPHPLGNYAGTFPPPRGTIIDSVDPGAPSGTDAPTIVIPGTALPDVDVWTIALWSAELDGADVPVAGGGPLAGGASWRYTISAAGPPLLYQLPDYRYLIPLFAPDPGAVGRRPRFYVKDLEAVMRPVGFGKPVTETAVFEVPTPGGRYRDLTPAEYAALPVGVRPPGGYPLKVKRDDGTFDHVAWLIPDA